LSECPIISQAAEITGLLSSHSNQSTAAIVGSGDSERAETQ